MGTEEATHPQENHQEFTSLIPKFTVLHPLSDRDSAQGKADVTKVGHGYSSTTRTLLHSRTIHSNIGQGQRAMLPIFARNTLLGGTILVNCLENERTVSSYSAKKGFFLWSVIR